MGEEAGELPRKFISFHCLENESHVLRDRNIEGTEKYPDFPHRSESEIAVIEGTETSPTKFWQCCKSQEVEERSLKRLRIRRKNLCLLAVKSVYCSVVMMEVKDWKSFCVINLIHSAVRY